MKRVLVVWMILRTRIAQRRSLLVEILRYPQNDDAKCWSENIFSGTSEIRGRRRLTNCFGGHSWSWQRWSDNNRAERRAARNGNSAARRFRLQHAWQIYKPRRLLPGPGEIRNQGQRASRGGSAGRRLRADVRDQGPAAMKIPRARYSSTIGAEASALARAGVRVHPGVRRSGIAFECVLRHGRGATRE